MVTVSREVLQQQAEEFAAIIDEGFAPASDIVSIQNGQRGASAEAARRWRMTIRGVQYRLESIRRNGLEAVINAAIERYNERKAAEPLTAGEFIKVPDPVEEHRLSREVNRLRAQNKELLDRIVSLEDLRADVFLLSSALEAPEYVPPIERSGKGGRQSAILHISDVHGGEDVSLHEMDGLNSYNADICRARLRRMFQKTASILTDHRASDPVEEMIICLGGDMIDNNLREESRRGGSMPVVQSAQMVAESIAGGIEFLRREVGVPIRVYTSPGNHGRLTQKPHIVEGNIDNWDVMVSWGVEKIIGNVPDVRFFYTGSGEALFNVYGWWFLLRHGHEGAAGSGGMYGPVYKQVRGMYRAHTSYSRRGRGFHWVLQGHDHTHSAIPFGFANGSVVGYNAYAMRKLLADPSPAVQNLLIVEERLGVIAPLPLYLGDPSEGSLYEPPRVEEGVTGKPFRRVKAGRAA
jgi:hypothetical protein